MAEGLLLNRVAAPTAPAANKANLYLDTTDRRVKVIDDNGVISTLAEDGSKDRNLITNGSFRIQQRVAVASTAIPGVTTSTRAGQVADRWAVTTSVATNLNWQQVDTASAPETGLLARYYGSIISSTAGKKVMISQVLINSEMAHARGQKVRLSVKTNQKVGSAQTYRLGLLQLTASGTVDVCPAFLTGAWSTTTGVDPAWGTNLAAIAPDASPTGEGGTITGSYLNIVTTAASWQRSSAVFSVPTNAKNLVAVLFSDATGGTTDNISFSEFRLTQGTEIIDWVEMPIATELIRCQRFYAKSFPQAVVPAASVAVATGGTGAAGIIGKAGATALAVKINAQFPIPMWKTPVVTLFTPVNAGAVPMRIDGTTPAVQTAVAQLGLTDRGLTVTATGDAAGLVGDLVGVHFVAEAEFIT